MAPVEFKLNPKANYVRDKYKFSKKMITKLNDDYTSGFESKSKSMNNVRKMKDTNIIPKSGFRMEFI